MTALRRTALVALVLAFLQIVMGAVVRITGSGMGCGDNWPDCYGSYTPLHSGRGLLIEITHRYGAVALLIATTILAIMAVRHGRRTTAGSEARAVRTPALVAAGLVIVAALFGMLTVKYSLHPLVVVAHLAIAMLLVAFLVVAAVRAGAFGGTPGPETARSFRAGRVAVALTFLVLVLGALTANIPGAPAACQGFPWCRGTTGSGTPYSVHITHRIVAFLLLGHLAGAAFAARKRGDPAPVRRAAWTAVGAIVAQVLIAAAMVEMHLPAALRSLHQATGTVIWISVVAFMTLSARRQGGVDPTEIVRESPSRAEFATPEGVST
ncbi:MAG TPA: COX15/CtaA family protein [Gemmatimonadaceae bacterium]|nr:COX15/CtaA family protein [Gemmatimonadaceae bacterium]